MDEIDYTYQCPECGGEIMKANIVGYDWESSYLYEDLKDSRTIQVLNDLDKELHEDLKVGEIIDIDVADRTFACEIFEVMAVFKRSGIVKLEYRGGAS